MPYFQNKNLRQGYTRVNLGEGRALALESPALGIPEIINTINDNKELISTIANTYNTAREISSINKASQDLNPNKINKEINDKKEEMKKLKEYNNKLKNKEQEIIDSRTKLNEDEIRQIEELKMGKGFVKF